MRLWILHHYIDFENDPNLLKSVHGLIKQLAATNVNFEHDLLVSALEARGYVPRANPGVGPHSTASLTPRVPWGGGGSHRR